MNGDRRNRANAAMAARIYRYTDIIHGGPGPERLGVDLGVEGYMVEGERPVLVRYARFFEQPSGPGSRARKEASAAARMCIESMHSRFADPDARFVIALLIRIGEVGSLDIEGSLRKIGARIGELLGHAPDPTRLYRGMRALAGQTSLVERVSRQTWRLCMAGITDPNSPRHQRLLEETPTPCRLEIVERRDAGTTAHAVGPPVRTDADPDHEIDTTMAEIARVRAQVKQLDEERDARRAEVEHLKSERRQLEEQLLEREIMIETLERQLAELRDRPTVPVEADKAPALKATLKAERERRRATETRLRRLLSALRIKLEGEPEQGLDLDRILWDSLSATLEQQLAALEDENDEAELEPGHVEELQVDIELAMALTRRVPRVR